MGVVDGVTHIEEAAQKLAQLEGTSAGIAFQSLLMMEAVDGLLEGITPDESHGVIGPATGVGSQAVDRHDSGMLQAARDLGFEQESLAADGVVGVGVEDLLQRHLAVQLAVEGHEDDTEATPGMRAQDVEPLTVGGGRADRERGGAVGGGTDVGLGGLRAGAEVVECGLDVGVGEECEGLAGGSAGGDGGEALLRTPTVLLEVQDNHRLDHAALVGVQVAAVDEVVGKGARLVARPGLEGGDELALIDEPDLQGEQTEEEVASGSTGAMRMISRPSGEAHGCLDSDVGVLPPGHEPDP